MQVKISVVTGATSGIGQWIALGLAEAGHQLVLIARDAQRADGTAAWIRARVPAASIDIVLADLSLLAETRAAGLAIADRYGGIDVLINNAGVFRTRREETAEGHERVVAVNHLAPFVLTKTLVPALRPGARIVNTGSSTADRARIVPEDLALRRGWGMVRAYSQSKLALTMASFGWAQRLEPAGIMVNVVHPGAVATSLVRASGPIGLAWRLMAPFLLTEAAGADTPLHVALAPCFGHVTGAYVKRRQAVRPNRRALDAALLARVWDATESLADA